MSGGLRSPDEANPDAAMATDTSDRSIMPATREFIVGVYRVVLTEFKGGDTD